MVVESDIVKKSKGYHNDAKRGNTNMECGRGHPLINRPNPYSCGVGERHSYRVTWPVPAGHSNSATSAEVPQRY